ncbi:MAG TPA: tripartite tricarboxylate transporter substrate-binding protein, partial [Ramlibacter sp.]
MKRRSILAGVLLATAYAAAPTAAQAQPDFPPRQITIIVPFPAGGVSDQLARGVGQKLAESLKVPVVVDNRPGGSAQIAANAVKQAPADGATILIGDIGAFALNPSLYAKLSYDIQKDFTPLARLVLAPSLLVVPANSPFNTMADFVNAARSRPVNIASQTTGSGGHLFAELMRSQAQLKLNHVPYRGSAPALNDLIGGQVEIFFDPVITSGPFVKDGKLKALAYGGEQRSPQFPQVPTLAEGGWGNTNLVAWFGMVVRAETPR